MTEDELLERATQFYLNSHDFNGLPVTDLKLSPPCLKEMLLNLIKNNDLTINFGDIHPNPHIKAFEAETVDEQIAKIEKLGLQHACLYPSRRCLSQVVDKNKYQDRLFTLKLALGEPQLNYYSFDLTILELYRNDPRYSYNCYDDIYGSICVKEEHYESGTMKTSDKVFLKTFGFSYDKELNRAVAVFLCYLSCLSPEHQQIWNAKLLDGDYALHPDYRRQAMGYWMERVSIFTAFLEESHQVNEMCKLMGRPPLFREEFQDDRRPRNFSFLIRPTLKEFNDFVHLLDKMLSENINVDFFRDEIPPEEEEILPDGKVKVRPKGSMKMLEGWLNKTIRFSELKQKDEMIKTFKKIRKMRQKPAHSVQEDVFNQSHFKKQRGLIIEAYGAVRILRMILRTHPRLRNYQVPDWLQQADFWIY